MKITIDEVVIPPTLDPAGLDAGARRRVLDFIQAIELANLVEAHGYGTDELAATPEEILPDWLDTTYVPKRLFVARDHTIRDHTIPDNTIPDHAVRDTDGPQPAAAVHPATSDSPILGRATWVTLGTPAEGTQPTAGSSDVAWISVQVMPNARNHGIGTALLRHLEEIAAKENRHTVLAYTVSPLSTDPAVPEIPAVSGFGSVPSTNVEVRFLLANGYTLEQVERASRLLLPLQSDTLDSLIDVAAASAGVEYRLHQWSGRTPEKWLDDMALLFTRMSTDAPIAGLGEPEDVWTRQRLIDYETLRESDPRTIIVSTIEHVPSGRLVGLTELAAPGDRGRPVSQNDTIVLEEHRGHRLGMLLKAANLANLAEEAPGHPSVITFNAEENRHMLDVNEQIGFVPMGYEGAWKKVLPA